MLRQLGETNSEVGQEGSASTFDATAAVGTVVWSGRTGFPPGRGAGCARGFHFVEPATDACVLRLPLTARHRRFNPVRPLLQKKRPLRAFSLERANGIEPSTSSLGSLRSTTELRPRTRARIADLGGKSQVTRPLLGLAPSGLPVAVGPPLLLRPQPLPPSALAWR